MIINVEYFFLKEENLKTHKKKIEQHESYW